MSIRVAIGVGLIWTLSAAGPVRAQTQTDYSREAVFRCVDSQGQTHFGDSMPAACSMLDTEVLNERGMVIRVIEGARTRELRQQREKAEKAIEEQRQAQAQHDRMLIDTYLTVADIERLRDQRLEQLEAHHRITEQNIASLLERQSRIQVQTARFKPYSDKPGALPLPEYLAQEIVNSVNGLKVYRETLENNRTEQEELRDAFARDIERFKELKGID